MSRTKAKIFILTLLLALLGMASASMAEMKVYTLSLGSVDSGNTTESKSSGASTFAISGDGKSAVSSFIVVNRSAWHAIEITGVTVSQAQQGSGGTYSGNTFYIGAKKTTVNDDTHWALADMEYIVWDMALSGNSMWARTFFVPEGHYVKYYFGPSGNTPYDGATARVMTGLNADAFLMEPAIIIGSRVFTLNANSGISTAALDDYGKGIPSGTNYTELQVSSISGNSLFYTRDGKTFSYATANTLTHNDYRALNRDELSRIQMGATGTGSAVIVRMDHYNREP